mmetsp:Transcript_33389/g.65628  ORF Transcript_33389/g.65628 Transcript_33389/m.65628 type:complete len:139 (+) Transcript_33389:50-466(+)|eukprot:CAMPEP_0175140320 /NCGR_PEP_ID=MMETSP0087-20121206/11402_1 /TAXON_ID=136419 /ORGANISM="Unknown Unknown, Strain D1" /LENGTH=138 /DNA_ID=CAMNT_0016423447 /DNA_START=40 /DNA_END=456 /DNA_ORIENTATION=+
MSHSTYVSASVPHSFKDFWAKMGWDAPNWKVEGSTIGSKRTLDMPGVKVVDELVAIEETPNMCMLKYKLLNDDNPLDVKGWRGQITVYRNSFDENSCSFVYQSTYDSSSKTPAEIQAMVDGQFSGELKKEGSDEQKTE